MKKNITINLFGTLYNIDEDAYQLLEHYLDSMQRCFSHQEGGEEIADDIEHRVAELLWEKKEQGMEAINLDTVKEIIAKIGDADELGEGTSTNESDAAFSHQDEGTHHDSAGTHQGANSQNQGTAGHHDNARQGSNGQTGWDEFRSRMKDRRLYRDTSDKVLGGVCSGLARYFDFGDPVLWRLGFALLFLYYGSGLLLYLALWLIIPEACMPEDKLRAQGRPVNKENLNAQIINDTDTYQKQPAARNRNAGSGCLKVIFFFLLLGPLFGLLISVVIAIPVLFGMATGAAGSLLVGPLSMLPGVIATNRMLYGSGFLCVIIVLLLLIYLVIRALRGGNERPGKWSTMTVCVVILLCVVWGSYALTNGFTRFASAVHDDYRSHRTEWRYYHWDDDDDCKQSHAAIDSLCVDSTATLEEVMALIHETEHPTVVNVNRIHNDSLDVDSITVTDYRGNQHTHIRFFKHVGAKVSKR